MAAAKLPLLVLENCLAASTDVKLAVPEFNLQARVTSTLEGAGGVTRRGI